MRCTFCKRKTSVLLTCKYCTKDFCVKCRLQQVHNCPNISVCIDSEKNALKKIIQDCIIPKSKI